MLVLPAFDLYGKNVGDGNGNNRITAFFYKSRTNPKYTWH